jgi:hypothetical protein
MAILKSIIKSELPESKKKSDFRNQAHTNIGNMSEMCGPDIYVIYGSTKDYSSSTMCSNLFPFSLRTISINDGKNE